VPEGRTQESVCVDPKRGKIDEGKRDYTHADAADDVDLTHLIPFGAEREFIDILLEHFESRIDPGWPHTVCLILA
jgi:hypothetical protein